MLLVIHISSSSFKPLVRRKDGRSGSNSGQRKGQKREGKYGIWTGGVTEFLIDAGSVNKAAGGQEVKGFT